MKKASGLSNCLTLVLALLMCFSSIVAQAQAPTTLLPPPAIDPSPGEGIPNLNGVWNTVYIPDIEQHLGGPPPFTPYGLERWENRVLGKDPTGFCQPSGPSRVFHTPFPIQLIQTENQVTFLFEMLHTFHRVFMDGRGHPDPVDKTWWGHSIGRYEGNKLIVDTVGLNDRSWLSTSGQEHSDQLHLIQEFEKTEPNTIRYTVTYDDPVFFTEPWSMSFDLQRSEYDILELICTENNRDIDHFVTE